VSRLPAPGTATLLSALFCFGRRVRSRRLLKSFHLTFLSWILKVSLGGKPKTAAISVISPENGSETLSTLHYADQAEKVKNKAIVNEDPNAQSKQRKWLTFQEVRLVPNLCITVVCQLRIDERLLSAAVGLKRDLRPFDSHHQQMVTFQTKHMSQSRLQSRSYVTI
jgi:hypothetical protein